MSAAAKPYRIQAVLFDFDGTLTRPGALDFSLIREKLGCPPLMPVLEFIDTLPDEAGRRRALAELDRFETEGAASSRPNEDAEEVVRWLREKGLPLGMITRNSRASVDLALRNFTSLKASDFDLILTRDDPVAPKPAGDGVALAAARLGVPAAETLVVGDFILDIEAGRAAGALTVLLDPLSDPRFRDTPCDFRIRRLSELRALVGAGLPLPPGKLPNDILAQYLQILDAGDPSLLIRPGVGEDTAAVDLEGGEVLILKSDPITFATDAIGRYSVLVNANDIATAGARPRWFLTTLLLPAGTTPSMIRSIMQDLADMSRRWGIALCGGHTEITEAVRRPVVIGMMAGTVLRRDLVDKKQMREGDWVVLTKGVAVEGTAIIAREFETRLLQNGFTGQEIAEGRAFLDHISIIPEARAAARDGLATAMHDVTEGGLATALAELAAAGGHSIRLDLGRIPVFDLTRRFCGVLGLNPLGLIGSGSLLICCRPENGARLLTRLEGEGIAAVRIGAAASAGSGIEAYENGRPVTWPSFAVDEITRLF